MGWDPTVYSWALVGAGVVNLAVVWAVVARREVRAATPFAVMVTGVAVYAFGDAYRLGATTLDSYVQAHLVTVVGYLVVPPAFLLFVIAYSGRERWLDRRLVGHVGPKQRRLGRYPRWVSGRTVVEDADVVSRD